jgi:hypothetical protein
MSRDAVRKPGGDPKGIAPQADHFAVRQNLDLSLGNLRRDAQLMRYRGLILLRTGLCRR